MELKASPGPSPVPPMETPYLQLEARPGAEPGPRPGAWPGASNTIPLGKGLARGIGRVPPPDARPGSNRDPDNRGREAPQPEQTWLPPPQPGPCPDTYTPSAMSTTISRDFVKDLSAVDLADIQEGFALLRRQRLSNASLSASVVTPSVATPIAGGAPGAVPMKNLNDKLLPYDGQSEPFKLFRTMYERCPHCYQWDPGGPCYQRHEIEDEGRDTIVIPCFVIKTRFQRELEEVKEMGANIPECRRWASSLCHVCQPGSNRAPDRVPTGARPGSTAGAQPLSLSEGASGYHTKAPSQTVSELPIPDTSLVAEVVELPDSEDQPQN